MPDQPDDHALTPDQEAEVRRLLAESRHTEPTPEAVVARLDKVLTGLADEPVREATVVRLADRRRKAATMLIAAAAVIVVGVGLGQVLPGVGGDQAEPSSAGAADESAVQDQTEAESAPELADGDGGGQADEGAAPSAELARSKRRPVRLTSGRFARDAALLRDAPALDAASSLTDEEDLSKRDARAYYGLRAAGRREVCDPGTWGRGRYVAVIYEKTPGWVVLRPTQGSSQVIDLFLCGSESAVRSVTLPSP